MVDAPFSGGADNVLAGTLTVMLGGAPDDVERARTTVGAYADPIFTIGALGSALVVKLVNNALFAANIQLVAQAEQIANELGVDTADARRRDPAVEWRELRDGPRRHHGVGDRARRRRRSLHAQGHRRRARGRGRPRRRPGRARRGASTAVPPTSAPDERAPGGTAVVTGAGSGLGAAMADAFAAEGMAVAALDINREAAESVAARAGGRRHRGHGPGGRRGRPGAPSTPRPPRWPTRFGIVQRRLPPTSGSCSSVRWSSITADDWQWLLSVNVIGTANTVNAFLPLLRAADGPRHIVLTSSMAALVTEPRQGAYITTKFAVTGYGDVLRQELADDGIGVTVVFPSGMMTNHLESSRAARPSALGESVMRDEDLEVVDRDRGRRRRRRDDAGGRDRRPRRATCSPASRTSSRTDRRPGDPRPAPGDRGRRRAACGPLATAVRRPRGPLTSQIRSAADRFRAGPVQWTPRRAGRCAGHGGRSSVG